MADTIIIKTAPNAKIANKLLPEEAAIISQSTGLWAFTVYGQVKADGVTFDEAKASAADYYDARS